MRLSHRAFHRMIRLAAAVIVGCALVTAGSDGSGSRVQESPGSLRANVLDIVADPLVHGVMSALAVPAVVVDVRMGDTSWRKAFGVRALGADDPVTIEDYFRVGSTTKTMVGTIAWQLASEGVLALDDPVSKYRDDVPGGNAITLAQLLDMSSGLFSYNEVPAVARAMDATPERVWKPEELLRLAFSQPAYFAPGAGFRYSNTNTVLLGVILEQITGTPIRTLFADRVFGPLGLSHTSFPAAGDAALPTPSPRGYLYGTNESALISPVLTGDELTAVRAGTLRPTDVTELDPSWIWAAGGAVSTAADLTAYVRELVSGTRLLDAPALRRRLASAEPVDRGDPAALHYGSGLEAFGPMLGHDGAIPGFQTFMGYDPVSDLSVIVLCTVRDGPEGGRPANEIAYGIVRSLIGGH